MSYDPHWWAKWLADVQAEAIRHASCTCEAYTGPKVDGRPTQCGQPVTTIYPLGKGLRPGAYCAEHKGRMEPGKFGVIEK